jgi:hypothetical protein
MLKNTMQLNTDGTTMTHCLRFASNSTQAQQQHAVQALRNARFFAVQAGQDMWTDASFAQAVICTQYVALFKLSGHASC